MYWFILTFSPVQKIRSTLTRSNEGFLFWPNCISSGNSLRWTGLRQELTAGHPLAWPEVALKVFAVQVALGEPITPTLTPFPSFPLSSLECVVQLGPKSNQEQRWERKPPWFYGLQTQDSHTKAGNEPSSQQPWESKWEGLTQPQTHHPPVGTPSVLAPGGHCDDF